MGFPLFINRHPDTFSWLGDRDTQGLVLAVVLPCLIVVCGVGFAYLWLLWQKSGGEAKLALIDSTTTETQDLYAKL